MWLGCELSGKCLNHEGRNLSVTVQDSQCKMEQNLSRWCVQITKQESAFVAHLMRASKPQRRKLCLTGRSHSLAVWQCPCGLSRKNLGIAAGGSCSLQWSFARQQNGVKWRENGWDVPIVCDPSLFDFDFFQFHKNKPSYILLGQH